MVKNRPVIDPLAQRVGVENAAEENDRCLGGIPVLYRIAGRDSRIDGVFFGRLRWGFGSGWGRLRLGWCAGGGGGATSARALGSIWLFVWNLIIVKRVISGWPWHVIIMTLTFTVVLWELGTVMTIRPLPAVGVWWLLVSIIDNIGEDVSRLPVRWPTIWVLKGMRDIPLAVRHGIPTLPPFAPAFASRVFGGAGALATNSRTYIFVLAGRRSSIILRRLIEMRRRISRWRMPPSHRIFCGGVTRFARVSLAGVAKGRGVRTCKLRSVVGIMRRGRRRGSGVVVSRPPGRWTGVVIHYPTTGIRTINRDSKENTVTQPEPRNQRTKTFSHRLSSFRLSLVVFLYIFFVI